MLDPLFTLNAQNQRMLENTQRSSDLVQAQRLKETKHKGRKNHVTSKEMEMDFSDMSEDLLGDMDPDSFGSGGSAALFKQMWEEDIEEEEEQERRRREAQTSETLFDEGQSTHLIDQNMLSAQQPVERDGSTIAELEEEVPAPKEAPESYNGGSDPELHAENPADTEPTEEESPAREAEALPENEEAAAQGTAEEQHAPEQTASPEAAPEERAPVHNDSLTFDAPEESQAGSRPEKLSNSAQEEQAQKEADQAARDALAALGLTSLLDTSEGFIIRPDRPETIEIQEESAAEEAAQKEEEIPPLPAELGPILQSMMQGDATSPAYAKLQHLAGRFGVGVLSACAAAQTQICLIPRGQLKQYPVLKNLEGAGDLSSSGAAYVVESHTVLVAEELFDKAPLGFHPVLFCLAHAWDHALGGDDLASLHSPAVKAGFEASRNGLYGTCAPDSLAVTSPAHYFAQAVESYLQENDCRNPLQTREDLYDFDPSMYSYVEYLFKQADKKIAK